MQRRWAQGTALTCLAVAACSSSYASAPDDAGSSTDAGPDVVAADGGASDGQPCGPTSAVGCAADELLCDGFEATNALAQWSVTGGATVTAPPACTPVASRGAAVARTRIDPAAMATKTFLAHGFDGGTGASGTLGIRAFVHVETALPEPPPHPVLLYLEGEPSASYVSVAMGAGQIDLAVRTPSTGTPVTVVNPITLPTGSWHCIAVDVTFGLTGRVDVYVDDAPLATAFTGDLGASAFPAGIRFVDVGILNGPTAASVLYDDVAVGRRHIACN